MWSDQSSTARAFRARRERRLLRRALQAAGIDAPAFYEDVTESTMTTAARLAERGDPEWSLVVADRQTAGRGRLGRTWTSEPGSALLFSFVLRPSLDPETALLLTLLAGAAMAEACREVGGADVRCKWPNDLLLGEGKLAGILTEARVRDGAIQHAVVGIGVNLTAAPVDGAAVLGSVPRDALLTEFFQRFRARYASSGDAFVHEVLTSYTPLCATLGRRIRATTVDGSIVEGVAVDVDPSGSLVVRTDDGPRTVGFGEIEHLR